MENGLLSSKHTISAGCIAYVVQAIVNNFAPLLFINFKKEYGFSVMAIGFLILINFGIQLLVDMFSTKVIDMIGYRVSMLIGHILSAVGLLGLAIIPDLLPNAYVGVVICIVLYAIGGGVMEVLVSPIIEACPTGDKVGKMSFLHSFYCFGQALVIIVSTIFFATAGIDKWRILAVIWAVIPILNALYFLLVPIYEPGDGEKRLDVHELFAEPAFWVLFVLMFCSGAAEQSMSQWASAFSESALKVSKTVGDICGPCLFAIAMGLTRFIYSRFSGKIKLQRFMIYSSALGVTAYLLAIFSGNVILSLVGCVLVGVSVGILWPGTFSLAAAKLPLGGTAMYALLALAGDLGCGTGPALVGIVAGIFDDNLKKGLVIALIFPIAMIITIMKVNKKLAGKIVRERKTWIAIACAAVVVSLSAFTGGCSLTTPTVTKTTPTPTPTKIVVETPIPVITDTPAPTATFTPTVGVTSTPTPTRKPTATPTSAASGFDNVTITPRTGTVYATDSINVRSGPGTSYKVIGGGKLNEEFKVTGETSNGWWQISYNGGTAYVSQTYTAVKGTMPTASVTATPYVAQPTVSPTPTATPTTKPVVTNTPSTGTSFESYVNFDGKAYIAIDAETGNVLHAYNENRQYSPASLTKMMTALIAAEQYYLDDECPADLETLRWNDVEYDDMTIEGLDNEMSTFANVIKQATGKTFTAEQWIEAPYSVEERLFQTLMCSCADSAEALAYLIENNLTFFVEEMMEDKANELGLTNTHFTNAVGGDKTCGGKQFDGNVSTAADLAKIARALMQDGFLKYIVEQETYDVEAKGDIPAVTIKNTNLLLTEPEYKNNLFKCIGIKTGHTDEAGYCLASCGKGADGKEIIVITLGNRSKRDAADQSYRILDYIFRNER